MPESKLRFGEILVRAGLLDDTLLKAALAEQKKWGGRLGRILVEMGFVDEATVVAALSRHLNLPAVDLEATPPPPGASQLLAVQDCERFGVFPVAADRARKTLRLATSDPTNYQALQELETRTGLKIEPVVAGSTDIDKAIRRHYYGETTDQRALPVDLSPPQGSMVLESEERVEAPTVSAPAPADALVERIARLEELASRQARALRALVETLVDRKQLDRDEYIRRVRGDDPQ
jgi:type IV pilus assembly protein PilB